jgi:hypothetical protein
LLDVVGSTTPSKNLPVVPIVAVSVPSTALPGVSTVTLALVMVSLENFTARYWPAVPPTV